MRKDKVYIAQDYWLVLNAPILAGFDAPIDTVTHATPCVGAITGCRTTSSQIKKGVGRYWILTSLNVR